MGDTSWHSYPSLFSLGHRALRDLFLSPVNVEEKIDGSQFSFGKFQVLVCAQCRGPVNVPGIGTDCTCNAGLDTEIELRVRSKGAVFPIDAPPQMFQLAVNTVLRLRAELCPGWTYRAEFLAKPKHNTLAYDRAPVGNLILFDICRGHEDYLSYGEKKIEAERLGLECVPLLRQGLITKPEELRELFLMKSVLGGQQIEGIVIKPLNRDVFGQDKKLLIGKFVSESFKEVHQGEWKKSNPSRGDILEYLIASYRTPARWNKAIQHLAERGELEYQPRDIGKLIKEIPPDILKEEEDNIKGRLFAYFWPQIARAAIGGFPEHYKQFLLERQFNDQTRSATDDEGSGSGEGIDPNGGLVPAPVG